MNYIKIGTWWPFTCEYAYFDIDSYEADDIFERYGVRVRYKKEVAFEGNDYCCIMVKFNKRYEHDFIKAMNDLRRKILFIPGHGDYLDFIDNILTQIEEA
ncbi:MAG: hypothetical protein IJJ25_00320 [Lachnospiraceae bacterium]|nr:hypothetical protein [Lachnospiraceae bacterium]MBQ6482762.1 hypothetical protein [Anaerolineaceae bacterium]